MSAIKVLYEANLHNSVWGGRIISAEMNGKFQPDDVYDASNWVTCACGELEESLLQKFNGARGGPKDSLLKLLGEVFHQEVLDGDIEDAAHTLVNIQRRATKLLLGEQV